MKKVISICTICLVAMTFSTTVSCSDKKNNLSRGDPSDSYIDLGLPSGTKWKTTNEKNDSDVQYDFFTFEEALKRFGQTLPSLAQCKELKVKCQWSWTGCGYKVTGPNGNSITLPAAGYCNCSGSVGRTGFYGYYWTYSSEGPDYAWCLDLDLGGVGQLSPQCDGYSVRLVQD